MNSKPKYVVHWPNFGPYHIARLTGCGDVFPDAGVELLGLETASKTHAIPWGRSLDGLNFRVRNGFENIAHQDLSRAALKKRLYEILDAELPAAVAINGYGFLDSRVLLGWCEKNNCPAVLMSESKVNDAPRKFILEAFKRRVIGKFDAYFCSGPSHREYLIKLGASPDKIVMGYGVVGNQFFQRKQENKPPAPLDLPALSSNEPFFLASARLVKRKNISFLIRAYQAYRALLSDGDSPWRLVVIGEGPEQTNLKEQIKDQNVKGVELLGYQDYPVLPEYYRRAKVFIHPALQEQWGLVVNEAMSSRLPVLVSRPVGCVESLVREGQNGFLFDPKNVDELAAQMLKIHTMPEQQRQQMGKLSEEIISDFTPHTFADNILKAFDIAVRSK